MRRGGGAPEEAVGERGGHVIASHGRCRRSSCGARARRRRTVRGRRRARTRTARSDRPGSGAPSRSASCDRGSPERRTFGERSGGRRCRADPHANMWRCARCLVTTARARRARPRQTSAGSGCQCVRSVGSAERVEQLVGRHGGLRERVRMELERGDQAARRDRVDEDRGLRSVTRRRSALRASGAHAELGPDADHGCAERLGGVEHGFDRRRLVRARRAPKPR